MDMWEIRPKVNLNKQKKKFRKLTSFHRDNKTGVHITTNGKGSVSKLIENK